MSQFLVAIQLPDDFNLAIGDVPEMDRDIDLLNQEMVAAGIRVFVGGLMPVSHARSIRRETGGKVMVTDGPYAETKEHIGGFWVLELPSLDDAVEWGRKAAIACRAPVEVRPFHTLPD